MYFILGGELMKKTIFILALILVLSLSMAPFALADSGTEETAARELTFFEKYNLLIMLAMIVPIFYFMIIRPEKKRKQAAQQLRNDLIVTDEVTTIGGIVGKVVQIKDEQVVIETGGERTRITILRTAISSRREKISE
jgi:preprotein translocase YajC subunit